MNYKICRRNKKLQWQTWATAAISVSATVSAGPLWWQLRSPHSKGFPKLTATHFFVLRFLNSLATNVNENECYCPKMRPCSGKLQLAGLRCGKLELATTRPRSKKIVGRTAAVSATAALPAHFGGRMKPAAQRTQSHHLAATHFAYCDF